MTGNDAEQLIARAIRRATPEDRPPIDALAHNLRDAVRERTALSGFDAKPRRVACDARLAYLAAILDAYADTGDLAASRRAHRFSHHIREALRT
jgi:hypothetical protein